MNLDLSDSWGIYAAVIGGVATLAIYSFLVKENVFYRFFEHLFIGIAAGLGVVSGFKDFLWPKVIEPLFGLNIVVYPDGTLSQPYNPLVLLYLLPIGFGLLYYTIFSKRLSWLAKLVIGFSLGMSGGIAFRGFFNEILPQISSSFKPLVVQSPNGGFDWLASLDNAFFVFTLVAVMVYFFFSFQRTAESPSLRRMGYAGRWLMMVCFGAFFGSTVMARMALLVERVQFLLSDWLLALKVVFL